MAPWIRCVWLILILAVPEIAVAQRQFHIDEYKSEVGVFYTGINLKGFGETVNGLGARFGYNIHDHLSVDIEFSFSPRRYLRNNQVGQKGQMLAGVKAGVRSRYIGVFAKARPGVMSIGEVTSDFSCRSNDFATICRPSHNNLAFDAGGVLEIYPLSRLIIRFDGGDTIVRIRRATLSIPFNNPSSTSDITQNFQFAVGFGYRF